MVFIVAASLSVAIALADQVIVQIKRHKARKKAEAMPVGSAIIIRKPLLEETAAEQDGAVTDEAAEAFLPEEP
jgi:hypothetical protein